MVDREAKDRRPLACAGAAERHRDVGQRLDFAAVQRAGKCRSGERGDGKSDGSGDLFGLHVVVSLVTVLGIR